MPLPTCGLHLSRLSSATDTDSDPSTQLSLSEHSCRAVAEFRNVTICEHFYELGSPKIWVRNIVARVVPVM